MLRALRFFLCVICICTISDSANAQQVDFWQWNTVSIDKSISKKFSVGFDEEVRFFRNASQLNLLYTNIGGSYKPNKFIKVSLVYRFLQKRQDDNSYSFRHRVFLDLAFKYKVKIVSFTYRSRLQSQVRDLHSSEKGYIPENYWRSKFDFKFDLKKRYSPYLSAEFRYQFANWRIKEANNQFNRGRYYAGFDYKLGTVVTFGLYYMLQWEFNLNDPERDHVLGTALSFSL